MNYTQIKLPKRAYSIEAPDHQRLKIARTEIEAILKKHDLAGVVVLHTPGMSEFFYDITPSYSCAYFNEATQYFRVKSKLADYPSAEEQRNDQAATANMSRCIASEINAVAPMFNAMARLVDSVLGADHTAGEFRPDPAEKNGH